MPISNTPLIFIDEAIRAGADPRGLQDAARRGHVVRLRRGVYCPRAEWEASDDRARHILRVRAVVARLTSPALVAGRSAAAVLDLPILGDWPDVVTLLVPYRGGGTAEPGVIRTSAGWAPEHRVAVAGLHVTRLERTLLDLVRIGGLGAGVAAIDAALRAERTSTEALHDFLRAWNPPQYARRMARAILASTPLSGSFGESLTRIALADLGYPTPMLQAEFDDGAGRMIVDFFWPVHGVVLEFDGRVKYEREEFSHGDPTGVLWREKQREDRLRRIVRRVVRATWEDVRSPARLAALLDEAGLPRRHRFEPMDSRARVSFAR